MGDHDRNSGQSRLTEFERRLTRQALAVSPSRVRALPARRSEAEALEIERHQKIEADYERIILNHIRLRQQAEELLALAQEAQAYQKKQGRLVKFPGRKRPA